MPLLDIPDVPSPNLSFAQFEGLHFLSRADVESLLAATAEQSSFFYLSIRFRKDAVDAPSALLESLRFLPLDEKEAKTWAQRSAEAALVPDLAGSLQLEVSFQRAAPSSEFLDEAAKVARFWEWVAEGHPVTLQSKARLSFPRNQFEPVVDLPVPMGRVVPGFSGLTGVVATKFREDDPSKPRLYQVRLELADDAISAFVEFRRIFDGRPDGLVRAVGRCIEIGGFGVRELVEEGTK